MMIMETSIISTDGDGKLEKVSLIILCVHAQIAATSKKSEISFTHKFTHKHIYINRIE